jgi:pimeloyl-ACP methyl ester carboxylesterase
LRLRLLRYGRLNDVTPVPALAAERRPREKDVMAEDFASRFVTVQDGLRLHVRSYGRNEGRPPVICLPGLARTGADFHKLASGLAAHQGGSRQVIALDMRGRGLSDYDRNPQNYSFQVELADVLAVLTALEIGPAVFVGTSRGGILTMLLAAVRPGAIAGVVLNDIGPVIEAPGLMRIKSYVGKLPQPRNFDEGAEILRRLFQPHFPKLTSDDWVSFAHRTFKQKDGVLVPDYDPKLAKILDGIDLKRTLPPLWREFDALGRVPVMVIRGANSDLLSAATVAAMQVRRPDMTAVEVPDQGHAPLLSETETIERIASFVASCTRTAH